MQIIHLLKTGRPGRDVLVLPLLAAQHEECRGQSDEQWYADAHTDRGGDAAGYPIICGAESGARGGCAACFCGDRCSHCRCGGGLHTRGRRRNGRCYAEINAELIVPDCLAARNGEDIRAVTGRARHVVASTRIDAGEELYGTSALVCHCVSRAVCIPFVQ